MPTPRQLELFIAVAEAGSMRRAADELGISQPSISKQIKALERAVGGELIVRSRGGRATLSRLGAELLEDMRSSVAMHRRLVERQDGGTARRPQIFLRSFLLEIIKRRLSEFEAAGLPVDTSFVVSDDPLAVMAKAASARDSLAIFSSISLPATRDLITHVVLEQTCSVYAAPTLARDLSEGSLRIESVPTVYPSERFKLTPWLKSMMKHAGLDSGKEVFGPQFVDLVVEQIADGDGLAIFMDMHVKPLVDEGRLVPVARCRDSLFLVLQADPAVDPALFARVRAALRAL